jgi:hypothetical protein
MAAAVFMVAVVVAVAAVDGTSPYHERGTLG